MPNENCLEGMKCPECGSEGPFHIRVSVMCLVTDNGIQDYRDSEWGDDDTCMCGECDFDGTVSDFKAEPEKEDDGRARNEFHRFMHERAYANRHETYEEAQPCPLCEAKQHHPDLDPTGRTEPDLGL